MRYNIDDESICDKLKTRPGAYNRKPRLLGRG